MDWASSQHRFIAQVKLRWRTQHPRDPTLCHQLNLEALPALSTANVRELLQAVLPLPKLTSEQARHIVAARFVRRARSTTSRLDAQQRM